MEGVPNQLNFNEEIIKKINIKNVNKDNLIQSYLMAIDNKNIKEIETLYNESNKNNNEVDIVYEMYNKNKLNSERLQFIIKYCTQHINISSLLIKKLMKDNNKDLLDILFKDYLKCFDNSFIIKLLNNYKSKIPLSKSELYDLINDNKNKISIESNKFYKRYDSSSYLFNACKDGNEAAVKFLLRHGADITITDDDNRIVLAWACSSGNLNLVKYLVHLGVDINNENNFGVTHMFNACKSGNLNLVKYLVEQGLSTNKESLNGYTPLFNACSSGNLNLVKYLMEHGADIK